MMLADIVKNINHLETRVLNNPMLFFRPTPPQLAFLKDQSPIKLLLGGNQVPLPL